RGTADDVNPDGTPNTEALRLTLSFGPDGHVSDFMAHIDQMTVRLGSFVKLTATNFNLDTSAGPSQDMVSFTSVGATVTVGPLQLTGEARNFGFTGDGTFDTKTGFGVVLSIGSATGDSFKWPSFLPIQID